MWCLLARIQALLARIHSRAHDVSTGLCRRGTLQSLDKLACIVLASWRPADAAQPCTANSRCSKEFIACATFASVHTTSVRLAPRYASSSGAIESDKSSHARGPAVKADG
eukprot:scaffold646_cov77-Phaeocystis_antarctica.AAC.2